MNHLKWMGHPSTIFEIQKSLHNEIESSDVTIATTGHFVRAHRVVLSACSDYLRVLLSDVPLGQDATILVPDLRPPILDSVLGFIYLGETSLTSSDLSEFLEAIGILGIKSAISFECNTAALANAASEEAIVVNALTKSGTISIDQDDIIDGLNDSLTEKLNETIVEQHPQSNDLEFLDAYSEQQQQQQHQPHHHHHHHSHHHHPQQQQQQQQQHHNHHIHQHHSKITYSIEHLTTGSSPGEYIFAGPAESFDLPTTNSPHSGVSDDRSNSTIKITASDDGIAEMDDDGNGSEIIEPDDVDLDDSQIIEEYETASNGSSDPIIEMSENATIDDDKQKIDSLSGFENYVATMGKSQADHDLSMQMAANAVLVEGMSLQKAAQKYEISKTVLWRRVRKHPNYIKSGRENPILTIAFERLKSGESLTNVSRELDIPMSTLHRYKVRMAAQGRLPKYMGSRKRESLTKDELQRRLNKAFYACIHDGMTQNHAANLFEIPKSTLWRHLQKRVTEAEEVRNATEAIKNEIVI